MRADQPFVVPNPEGLFSDEEWSALFDEIAADAVADQVVAGATDAAVAGDVSDVALERAVREHVERTRGLAVYLKQSVADVVTEAMRERLTLNETVERLRQVSSLSEESARMTARTEAVAAANAGLNAVWAADPGVLRKRWGARDDGRTRPAHEAADGQTVTVAATFSVAGVPARYPGDPALPIALRANCRCRILPVGPDGTAWGAWLHDTTRSVLDRIAMALGVSGRSRMNKAQLTAAVRQIRFGEGLPLERLNMRQLRERARDRGVKGRWRMGRDELMEALSSTP